MGCGCEQREGKNCVCEIVEEIIDAQNDITENCCTTSCEQSINDLLGEDDAGNGLDTVPIILYCKDNCKPFQGFGALPRHDMNSVGKLKGSFIFRPKKMLDNCCAVVELVRSNKEDKLCFDDPCEQDTKDLEATGICITVDLKCFCHITCLPAVSLFHN